MQFGGRALAHHAQSLGTGETLMIVANIFFFRLHLQTCIKLYYDIFAWEVTFLIASFMQDTIKVHPEAGEIICHPDGSPKPENQIQWGKIRKVALCM